MKGRSNRNFWHKHGYTVIIYVFLAALMVFINIFNKDFFTLGNFKNLLRSSFPLLMATLGQTLITLTEGVDLSLGGIVALRNVVCVTFMSPDSAWGLVPALGAAAATDLVCEAVNGVLVIKRRLVSIIVTIAIAAASDEMALLLMPNPGGSVHKVFAKFLTWGYSGAVLFLLFVLILYLVRNLANSIPYGRVLRAIGGNESVTHSTGIWVGKIKLCAYCLAGFLCAVAGIFLNAQMNLANVTIGKDCVMNTITATVVDGTVMTGAVRDPLGTIAGALVISIINNMLNLFSVSPFHQFICWGLILITALLFSALHKRRQGLWGLIVKDRKVR